MVHLRIGNLELGAVVSEWLQNAIFPELHDGNATMRRVTQEDKVPFILVSITCRDFIAGDDGLRVDLVILHRERKAAQKHLPLISGEGDAHTTILMNPGPSADRILVWVIM